MVKKLIGLGAALLVLSLGTWILVGKPNSPVDAHADLLVMTHSSFMNAWGPGPEIAKRFKDETGIAVQFHDAGDAGLILEKLKLFPVDVVIGLDGLSLDDARSRHEWRGETGSEFIAYDTAPLAFIYREGEVVPPTSLKDLLDPRFRGLIALQDPRTSTPGLQFFFWVLDEMGVEEGFKFLAQLKPNLHSVSPSWSSAYGTFTKKQSALAFSYVTSPMYHLIEEKDSSYRAAIFETGHPVQTEYAAIPKVCSRCADAEKFIEFLQRTDIQQVIMTKNFMMPVNPDALKGTPFADLPQVEAKQLSSSGELMLKRAELFERWRALGL